MKPLVTILVGPSGSGKSTYARELVDNDPHMDTVRLNRDDVRSMLHLQQGNKRGGNRKNSSLEPRVIDIQFSALATLLDGKFSVVVDDTNLNPRTVERLKDFSEAHGAEVRVHQMPTSLAECIARDSQRRGKAHVGRAVIERQFLAAGMLTYLAKPSVSGAKRPIAIVDIDGTLAQNTVNRSPYDESKVLQDPVYPAIAQWVRDLYYGIECEGNPNGEKHIVLLVSDRRSTCGEDTLQWLRHHRIPFDHLLMRAGWDNRPDTIVKSEILDELLRNVGMDQISLVIDDRPSVLNMWVDRGLRIFPAREVKEPF